MAKAQRQRQEFGESFYWPVAASGYDVASPDPARDALSWGDEVCLESVNRAPDRALSGKSNPDEHPPWLTVADPSQSIREYNPLTEEPTLYRDFARLSLDTKTILDFANRHGCLLRGQLLLASAILRPGRSLHLLGGESLWMWAEEINAMREAVDLLDAIRDAESNGHGKPLERLIAWRMRRVAYTPDERPWSEALPIRRLPGMGLLVRSQGRAQRAPSGREEITIPLSFDPLFRDWSWRENRIDPAKQYLAMIVNKRARGKVSPALQIVEGRSLSIGFRTSLMPEDLLGAMWLQLLQDLAGRRRIRKCLLCGKEFDAVDDPRQLYCRTRGSGCKKEANRIRDEVKIGIPLREVADKHRIPLSTLEKVLERRKSTK